MRSELDWREKWEFDQGGRRRGGGGVGLLRCSLFSLLTWVAVCATLFHIYVHICTHVRTHIHIHIHNSCVCTYIHMYLLYE